MFSCIMPFNASVEKRSTAFSEIKVRVRDKETDQYVNDHPALKLLEKPNADVSQQEFLKSIASDFDITGNSFIAATGRIDNPPLELIRVSPIEAYTDYNGERSLLNLPKSIRVTSSSNGGQWVFDKQELRDLGLRYINKANTQEIWHVRSYTPKTGSGAYMGMPKAKSFWYEAEQYRQGNINNLSILERGATIPLAWVNNRGEELTDAQWDRIQEEAEKYKGARNAGGIPVLDGMDVKPIQQSNRDMEFKDLQQNMESRIYLAYAIPLPLVSQQVMTMANMEVAQLQFYDNSVLPLANTLYSELTRLIMPRFPDSENLEFCYNELDIPALKARANETAKKQSSVGVLTVNELRASMGYEALAEGGDQIVRDGAPAFGEDAFTDDNLQEPVGKKMLINSLVKKGYSEEKAAKMIKDWC